MDAERIKGMAIVSMSEASRLGAVTDILFEAAPLRVAALQGASDAADFEIPFSAVRSIGADAVIVESSQVTQMASGGTSIAGLMGLALVQRLKVVDDAGTFLGTVHGVAVDPATGAVLELIARKGGVLGMGRNEMTIPASSIRTVGMDVLTVDTASAPAQPQP